MFDKLKEQASKMKDKAVTTGKNIRKKFKKEEQDRIMHAEKEIKTISNSTIVALAREIFINNTHLTPEEARIKARQFIERMNEE